MAAALNDQLLLSLRAQLPVGRERPISGRLLAARLGISYRGVQERIASLIEDHEVSIGSNPRLFGEDVGAA
jgi:biotin operon repressor